VVVGFIALAGVAAETGVVMLIYLNQALAEVQARCAPKAERLTRADLYDAIMEGAVERVRPKMMTVVAIMAGLAADPVEHRHRLRNHAAHRRADDRRHDLVHAADAGGDPRDLRHRQRDGGFPGQVPCRRLRSSLPRRPRSNSARLIDVSPGHGLSGSGGIVDSDWAK
jgi:hypothetical protein